MTQIAEAEIARDYIPENNHKTKHIKLVATIGLMLNNKEYVQYAIDNFKNYIANALYEDGTTHDLHQRDALSYHVSGLKPLLTFAITLGHFGESIQFAPFRYESPAGGSIKKSVDYVMPYAIGEKKHKEWVNTKVELDRQRAEAGLKKYQPGIIYKPEHSLEMFELAYYFDQDYKSIIQGLAKEGFKEYNSWFLLLIDVAREIK